MIQKELREQKEVKNLKIYFDLSLKQKNPLENHFEMLQWERFMRCSGLPNAHDPADLRKYLHMWQIENEKINSNEQDWLLYTDERTVLTQNKLAENLTREMLKEKQPNLGHMYAQRTTEILNVFIRNENQTHLVIEQKQI